MERKKFNAIYAILATGVLSFGGVLIETAMNVTFPLLIEEFGLTTSQVHWVTTIYLLVISITIPISPFLNKNYSTRSLFRFAMLVFILGVIIDAISFNFTFLLLGRLFQGLATGIAIPLMFNIILTRISLDRRGMMIGIGTLTTSIAPALGPTYGGLLTSTFGWRYIYVFLLPILIMTYILGMKSIPKEETSQKGSLNITAIIFLSIFFITLLLSFNYFPKLESFLLIVLSIISLIFFLLSNKRKKLLDLSVLSNQMFRRTLLAFLIIQSLLLGLSFVIPSVIQIVFGKTPFIAGIIMFPGALIGSLVAPVSGKLLDKFGERKPIIIGGALSLVSLVFFIMSFLNGSMTFIISYNLLIMLGFGLSYSNLMTVGLSCIREEKQADGNAIFSTLQQFSGALATSFVALSIKIGQTSHIDYSVGTLLGAVVSLIILTLLLSISFIFVFKILGGKNNEAKF